MMTTSILRILITCLLDNVCVLYGEATCQSLQRSLKVNLPVTFLTGNLAIHIHTSPLYTSNSTQRIHWKSKTVKIIKKRKKGSKGTERIRNQLRNL